jgi:hypothetical protein
MMTIDCPTATIIYRAAVRDTLKILYSVKNPLEVEKTAIRIIKAPITLVSLRVISRDNMCLLKIF